MKICAKTLAGCTAIILLALGCEAPQPRETAPAQPAPVAVTSNVLDPAAELAELGKLELKIVWRQNLGQIAEGKAVREAYVAGDILALETLDSSLFYFNAASGVWKSSTRLKSPLTVPPAASGKTLYAVTGRGLLVIDAETGFVQRQLPTRMPVVCQPVLYGESLILGGGNGKVARFDPVNGQFAWIESASTSISGSPAVAGGIILAAGHKGRVMAVAAEFGKEIWNWHPNSPAYLTSGVEAGGDKVYVGDNRGFVYALTVSEGVPVWKYPTGGPVSLTPALIGTRLLVFTYKGDALCLDVGEEVKAVWKSADAERLIAAGKKHVYVLTRDRALARISLETGEESWRVPLCKSCSIASVPSQPMIYLYDSQGHIVALTELD